MTVEFQYLLANQIYGPCAFEELVAHVRDGILSADDLVKPSSDDRWIPAATIYGLFHMAGRQYKLTEWEEKRQRNEGVESYDSYDSVELEEIRSGINARQQETEFDQQPEAEVGSTQTVEAQTEILQREQQALEEQRAQERLDFALAAANELKSEKHPHRRGGLVWRFLTGLFSK